MGAKLVTIVGVMYTQDDPGTPNPNPPGIWGGGNVPMPNPPIANVPGVPGYNPNPPIIWGPPGPWPTPPIAFPPGWIGGVPPGIWGGGNVPMPNPPIANVPGVPGYNPNPPGIWGPPGPWPTPPIQLPPWLITGGNPPGIWGGGNVPMPNPPIANVPPFWNPDAPKPPDGGELPTPPGGTPPGGWGSGGVTQPIAPITGPFGKFAWYWSPAWGWVAKPIEGSEVTPPVEGEKPVEPPVENK